MPQWAVTFTVDQHPHTEITYGIRAATQSAAAQRAIRKARRAPARWLRGNARLRPDPAVRQLRGFWFAPADRPSR